MLLTIKCNTLAKEYIFATERKSSIGILFYVYKTIGITNYSSNLHSSFCSLLPPIKL